MFKPNQIVYTRGLDSKCRPVTCTCVYVEARPVDEFGRDCVIQSKGITMLSKSSELRAKKVA
jgi:hypothetical protein